MTVRTLGWLNHSLADLLRTNHWPSLASYFDEKQAEFDEISVSVPGPVDEEGRFHRSDLTQGPSQVSFGLRGSLETAAGRPVKLIKDADAWIMGFLRYQDLIADSFEFQVLLLALGTGVGVSIATVPRDTPVIYSAEISSLPVRWHKLCESAKYKMKEPWEVHRILGRRFFSWVEENHPE